MRLFIYILLALSLLNCKSKKSFSHAEINKKNQIFNLDNCAADAKCSIEIIQNSNLLIEQDEDQNSYINLEKGDGTIIKYEFKRNEPPNTADAYYSELIYFQIDNNNKQLFLTNNALQDVKMMYGRFCYCKGTSGYFKVTKGRLKLSRIDNEISIDLHFKVGKIPQLITDIKETITLQE